MEKNKVLKKLASNDILSASDWNKMYGNPSCDYLEYIFQNYYPVFLKDNLRSDYKDETIKLVSLLREEEVIPIVYKYYPQNKAIENIIVGCNLFDPVYVLKLLDVDKKLAIQILKADKPYYNSEDLSVMEQIIKYFDALPDISTHTKGKLGLFGKEAEIIICPFGHKYSAEQNYCPTCGSDVRGLTADDRNKIEYFKSKVQVIRKELNAI